MNPSTLGADRGRRSRTTAASFGLGLPLAAAILAAVHLGPEPVRATAGRYLEHPVEWVEVVLFSCAIGALGSKLWQARAERAACAADVLPPWDGKPLPVGEAAKLLAGLQRLPGRLRNTFLARRVGAVLEFLCQRRSAADLDDQLRALADNDVIALEGSYALTRFITWAIPILGFLGTVLGITGAISGVKSDDLELGSVTGGLAYAFDATALALGLTMITMFCSFLTERGENGVLEEVDRMVDRQLAHRWERAGADTARLLESLRQSTQAMLEATAQLVQGQAEVWARTFAETERRAAESHGQQQVRVAAALEAALDRTLQAHAQRMAAMEKQALEGTTRLLTDFGQVAVAVRDTGREHQAGLARIAEGIAAQAGTLGQLVQGEKHLIQLQAALHQNLQALAGAGSFDQAVHSLTAAIHLLTARAPGTRGEAPALPLAAGTRPHPGKAA